MSVIIQPIAGDTIKTIVITVTQADDLAGLPLGQDYLDKTSTETIPSGAVWLGFSIKTLVNFDGGFGNPMTCDYGPVGDESIWMSAQQISTALPRGELPSGWFVGRSLPETQITWTFQANGQDYNTYTQGSATATLFYFIP